MPLLQGNYNYKELLVYSSDVKQQRLLTKLFILLFVLCSLCLILIVVLNIHFIVHINDETEEVFLLSNNDFNLNSNLSRRSLAYSQATFLYQGNLKYNHKHLDLTVPPEKQLSCVKDNFKLVCYYSIPQNETHGLQPHDIDANLCTHIILAFAMINSNGTLTYTNSQDLQFYRQVIPLRQQNPDLKLLISITDGGTGHFAKVVSSKHTRAAFAVSARNFLEKYSFDGIDLDWEFPGWPKGDNNAEEKRLFRKLIQQLKYVLKDDFLVTVAVAAPGPIIDAAYDIDYLSPLVDFVSIMAYDYHAYFWYLPVLGPNAPLYPSLYDKGYFKTLNINWTVSYYLYLGMPANKIVLGMPTYGHSFTLVNPCSTDYDMPAKDIGRIGHKGFVDYCDIMKFLMQNNTQQVLEHNTRVPYVYGGDQWISYDNQPSLTYKTEYLMSKRLAGAMVWSLNTDDYAGKYNKVKFPLVNRIKIVLDDNGL